MDDVDRKLKRFFDEYGKHGDRSRLSSQLNALEMNLRNNKDVDKIVFLKRLKDFL